MISDVAKLNLALAGVVVTLVVTTFIWWPSPQVEVNAALASPYCTNLSSEISILGKAAFLGDISTGRTIYAKNATAQLPLASLTKLMTVLTAADALQENDPVFITAAALAPEGGSIYPNETWRAGDLMDYTLIVSDNDGAHALALAAAEKTGGNAETFVQAMNEKARAIGLVQTYYTNDTGLDTSEAMGSAYGSAYDMALLLGYLVTEKPHLVEGTAVYEKTFTTLDGEVYEASNTSSVIGGMSGAVASKTGFTDLAGGNLGIVFEPILGHPVVAVVLGSTREGRDEDILKLSEYSKRWLTRAILCKSI